MSPETQQLTSKALSLIEQSRYRMGTSRFVEAFIDQWAYLQTGLYPAKEEIPEELQPVAFELSHVLSAAIKRDPTSDVLGYVLSMSGFHKKGTNYFPTPPEIGRLMSLIVGSQSSADFYEPCCGSGINAIHWMENLIENHGPEALREASIYLEDIDPLMVKCCMIQLFHYFESRNTTPKTLSIVGIDTLSRRTKNIAYYAENLQQPPLPWQHKKTRRLAGFAFNAIQCAALWHLTVFRTGSRTKTCLRSPVCQHVVAGGTSFAGRLPDEQDIHSELITQGRQLSLDR